MPKTVYSTSVEDTVRELKTKYRKEAFSNFEKTKEYNEFAKHQWVINELNSLEKRKSPATGFIEKTEIM